MYYIYYLFKNDVLILTCRFTNFGEIIRTMETASFNGFLKTLFYIIIAYYVIKLLARIFLPMLVKKAVEKAGESFQQQQYRQYQQQMHNPNVTVDGSKAAKPRDNKNVGEYVDYEEID